MNSKPVISDSYRKLLQKVHAEGNFGMFRYQKERIADLCQRTNCQTILDYGSGTGLTLKAAMPEYDIREYDPGIPGKDMPPEPADLVVCQDVLEHIEPDMIDNVLEHIRSLAIWRCFFIISTRPAAKTLPDGRNAHLIIESADWWRGRLGAYFHIFEWEVVPNCEVVAVVKPKFR